MYNIVHYLDARGKDYYQDWLDSLRDRQAKNTVILLTCGGSKRSQDHDIELALRLLQD